MYYQKIHGTHFRTWESVEELIEDTRKARYSEHVNRNALQNEDFVGRRFNDWPDVYEAARSPWPEGVEVVERMVAELQGADLPKPANRRRKLRYDERDGDELDLDRLRDGRDYWRTTRRANLRGPQTVTIVIDVNASGGVAHRDILWRGAAALAMTLILEEAGFRVELWIVHRADDCYTDKTGHFHAVCLKRPQDPLDLATFTCAVSGWFYRSLMFRAKALGRETPRKSLGHPTTPGWFLEYAVPAADKAVVISGTYSYHGAVYLAREALKRLTTPPPKPEPDVEPVAVTTPTPEKAEPIRQPTRKEMREWDRRWKAYQKANREA